MMPMAPTMPVPTKTKLGFSIEALVGSDREPAKSPPSSRDSSPGVPLPSPPPAHSRTALYPATPTATFPVCLTGYGPPVAQTGYLGEYAGSPYYPALDLTPGQPLQQMMLTREHYALYPWLFARHHRFLPQRGPGSEAHGFILHPFRKPKRIRTAFSPSQLLKLEHAFEKNHYVVGAERKQLAQCLGLTETQVKVWFQNRRTKHKRQKQEEDQGDDASSSCQDGTQDHSEPEES